MKNFPKSGANQIPGADPKVNRVVSDLSSRIGKLEELVRRIESGSIGSASAGAASGVSLEDIDFGDVENRHDPLRSDDRVLVYDFANRKVQWVQGSDVSTVPAGIIAMWSGALGDVPIGWQLCDGTGGTPDLRDKFIYGWSAGVAPGGTGGAATHTHTFTATSGAPSATATVDDDGGGSTESVSDDAHTHDVSGTTDAGDNLPPYYKMAFIMKMADE